MQIGYQNPLANFRAALRQIVVADTIPDYRLDLVETIGDPDATEIVKRGRKTNPVRVVITRRLTALDEHPKPRLSRQLLSTAEPMSKAPRESGREVSRESPRESGITESEDLF